MKNTFGTVILLLAATAIVFVLTGCDDTENEAKTPLENVMANKQVKLQTTLGDIIVELDEKAAPLTVANFLKYVETGFYDGIIFHRVIRGFMVQTGGFIIQDGKMTKRQAGPPVKNEFGISNLRGTLAMAKFRGNPDSATSEFFINLVDNSGNLDNQNGGFTVFARVVKGMEVADKIAAVKTVRDVPVEPVVIESATVITGE